MKNLLIAFTALAILAFYAPNEAQAEENITTNYSMKKQNRVPFQVDTNDNASVSKQGDDASVVQPSEIEPAAGGYDATPEQKEDDLAKSMKLPRKN